jgi:hypothetical protein
MNLSPGFFSSNLVWRSRTIDPAQHFAVRVKGRYARPISRHAFTTPMGKFNRQAATLMRIAALGQEQAQRMLRTGESGEGARSVLHCALERSQNIQGEFDDFVRPVSFNDNTAHLIVEGTQKALKQADHDIRNALKAIDASLCEVAGNSVRSFTLEAGT